MTRDIPYSQYYKERMHEQFPNQINQDSQIQQKLNFKPLHPESNHFQKTNKKSNKSILLLGILIILLSLSFLSLLVFLPKSNLSSIIIACSGIIVLFLIMALLHKFYERSIIKTHPAMIIIFLYIILTINMILGLKIYSIEWAFLGFTIATGIAYDSKIDSRFLILPSLLLLGYIPFLLIGKYNSLAENIAIYVYYFLVCGIFLQVIEHIKKTNNSLNFNVFSKGMIKEFDWVKICILTGIISIIIIISNRFYELTLLKWSSVYIFTLCLIMYLLSTINEKTTPN